MWRWFNEAGVSGESYQLLEIDLYVGPSETGTGPTQLTLYSGAPWQPGASAWTQWVSLRPGWNAIRLTRVRFFVVAGQPFTVGLYCNLDTDCGAPDVGFSYYDAYVGGALYMNGEEHVAHDMTFQTWVQPR